MLARLILFLALLPLAPLVQAGQNVVIVLDDSGSMDQRMRSDRRTRKIDAAKSALRTVLEKLPTDAQVGLVILNGPDDWLIPLGPVDRSQVNQILNRIDAGGGTPLGRYMKVAADALIEARARQRYGTYKLLIVTDGEAGDQELVERYLPDIISRGLVVDVIGVDMQGDHSLATEVQTYRRADDPRSLQQAIVEGVLGESTADAGDAGESDFELLAGFPNEAAIAALEALARRSDQPVSGDNARQGASGGATSRRGSASPATVPGRTISVPASRTRSGGGGILSGLLGACCLGSFMAVIALIVALRLFSSRR